MRVGFIMQTAESDLKTSKLKKLTKMHKKYLKFGFQKLNISRAAHTKDGRKVPEAETIYVRCPTIPIRHLHCP